jgi:glutaredoxin 3
VFVVQGKKVMVFSKTYCPFCTKAKAVFKKLLEEGTLSTEDYEVMEIENRKDCDAIQTYLRSITGASSVSIFIIKVIGFILSQ